MATVIPSNDSASERHNRRSPAIKLIVAIALAQSIGILPGPVWCFYNYLNWGGIEIEDIRQALRNDGVMAAMRYHGLGGYVLLSAIGVVAGTITAIVVWRMRREKCIARKGLLKSSGFVGAAVFFLVSALSVGAWFGFFGFIDYFGPGLGAFMMFTIVGAIYPGLPSAVFGYVVGIIAEWALRDS